jgi:hypothetical protein
MLDHRRAVPSQQDQRGTNTLGSRGAGLEPRSPQRRCPRRRSAAGSVPQRGRAPSNRRQHCDENDAPHEILPARRHHSPSSPSAAVRGERSLGVTEATTDAAAQERVCATRPLRGERNRFVRYEQGPGSRTLARRLGRKGSHAQAADRWSSLPNTVPSRSRNRVTSLVATSTQVLSSPSARHSGTVATSHSRTGHTRGCTARSASGRRRDRKPVKDESGRERCGAGPGPPPGPFPGSGRAQPDRTCAVETRRVKIDPVSGRPKKVHR